MKNTDLTSLGEYQSISSAQILTYTSVIDADGNIVEREITNSDLIKNYYHEAAVGCKIDKNPQHCQTIANLCVLALYDYSFRICRFFKSLQDSTYKEAQNDLGWKKGLPWLYYSGESATNII